MCLHVLRSVFYDFRGVALDLGPDVPDPGIVEDGSPCFTNTSAKIKGVCLNQICVNLNKIGIKSCPDDKNGTVCSGRGVCFNCDIYCETSCN